MFLKFSLIHGRIPCNWSGHRCWAPVVHAGDWLVFRPIVGRKRCLSPFSLARSCKVTKTPEVSGPHDLPSVDFFDLSWISRPQGMNADSDYSVVRTPAGTAYGEGRTAGGRIDAAVGTSRGARSGGTSTGPSRSATRACWSRPSCRWPPGPCRSPTSSFDRGGWWKTLCGRFRRSRARRGWELGRALLARGIATPRPLAACEPREPLALPHQLPGDRVDRRR